MDRPARRHRGRRALVTGASRGIGAAIARRLAQQGADVALTARSEDAIATLADELGRLGVRAIAVPADAGDRNALQRLVTRIEKEFGGLDILVNNAGVLPAASRAEDVDWRSWENTINMNLSAPWYLACRAKELMGSTGGVIVNIASTAAYFPSRGLAAYNVSKAALVMLTRVLALEWAQEGVRVVGVAPGKIDTDLVAPIMAWTNKHDLPLNPLRRIGSVDEVADLVSFLISAQASYLTGVTVPLDGGELLTAGSEPGR
jgi:3-oxoacyl-[acyl-carrier protein] reductase